jgi:hypothetical protein
MKNCEVCSDFVRIGEVSGNKYIGEVYLFACRKCGLVSVDPSQLKLKPSSQVQKEVEK